MVDLLRMIDTHTHSWPGVGWDTLILASRVYVCMNIFPRERGLSLCHCEVLVYRH